MDSLQISFSDRRYTILELREILYLAKVQVTNDKFTDDKLTIDGDYAKIEVEIDSLGDFKVL